MFGHTPLLLHNDDLPSADTILRLGHCDGQPPVFVQAGDCSQYWICFDGASTSKRIIHEQKL